MSGAVLLVSACQAAGGLLNDGCSSMAIREKDKGENREVNGLIDSESLAIDEHTSLLNVAAQFPIAHCGARPLYAHGDRWAQGVEPGKCVHVVPSSRSFCTSTPAHAFAPRPVRL